MSDFKNGSEKLFYIYVNDTYMPVGCLTANDFSESVQMLDTTTRQNAGGWSSSVPTRQSYSISISGLATINDKSGTILTYNDLTNLKRGRTQFNWRMEGNIPGTYEVGIAYISDISSNAAIDENISFSASIIGQGEPAQSDAPDYYLNYTLNVTI